MSEPELFEDLIGTWDTFIELNRTRQVLHDRPQPISWQEINAYLDLRGIRSEEERDELVQLITALDKKFLDHVNSKKG